MVKLNLFQATAFWKVIQKIVCALFSIFYSNFSKMLSKIPFFNEIIVKMFGFASFFLIRKERCDVFSFDGMFCRSLLVWKIISFLQLWIVNFLNIYFIFFVEFLCFFLDIIKGLSCGSCSGVTIVKGILRSKW